MRNTNTVEANIANVFMEWFNDQPRNVQAVVNDHIACLESLSNNTKHGLGKQSRLVLLARLYVYLLGSLKRRRLL
jgi:hypothetical protein